MKISPPLDFSSNNAAAAGCMTGILRRFFCGSLRSSSNSREGEEGDGSHAGFGQEWKVEQRIMSSPCIVARLMGLESTPACPGAASELIGRSRSVKSLESWPGLPSGRSDRPHVWTSQSFREAPVYLRQENEEFLLLSFTPDDKEETVASNAMRHRVGFREIKERKSEDRAGVEKESRTPRRSGERKSKSRGVEKQLCHKENVAERKHEAEDSAVRSPKKDAHRKGCQGTEAADLIEPITDREMPLMSDRPSTAKKKLENTQGKVEPECSSQNSSPVSVLDLAYIDDDCSINSNSSSTEEEKQPKQQSSRTKLSSNFENVNCLSPNIDLVTFSRDGGTRSLDKESKRSSKPEQDCPEFADSWEKICRLAEEDLKNSTWISKEMWRLEGVEDLAPDLELEIMDLLLYEAIGEFSNHIAI